MKNETARREIESLDYYLQNHTDDYSEESHTAMMMAKDALNNTDVLEKIRAEIEHLHYHPKLDFIKNDEIVEMALDIIDKYRG